MRNLTLLCAQICAKIFTSPRRSSVIETLSRIYVSHFCRAVSQAGGGGGGEEAGGQTSLSPVLRKHLSAVSIHLSYLVDHSDRHLTFLNNTFSISLSVCLLVGTACLLVGL